MERTIRSENSMVTGRYLEAVAAFLLPDNVRFAVSAAL